MITGAVQKFSDPPLCQSPALLKVFRASCAARLYVGQSRQLRMLHS